MATWPEICALMTAHKPLDGLAIEKLLAIEGQARIRTFARRTELIPREEHKDHIYFVVAGSMEHILIGEDGSETTTGIFPRNSWISWLKLMDERPLSRDLLANQGSIVVEVRGSAMRALLVDNPEIYPAIVRYIGMRLQWLLDFQEALTTPDRTRRLARIVRLMNHGPGANALELPQHRLARLLGCSRQTLHTHFSALISAGAIERQYGRIVVADAAMLRALAEEGPGSMLAV